MVVSKKSKKEMSKQYSIEKSKAGILGEEFNAPAVKKQLVRDLQKNRRFKAAKPIPLICHSFEVFQDMYDISPPIKDEGKYMFSEIGCFKPFPIDFVRIPGKQYDTFKPSDSVQAVGMCNWGHLHILSDMYVQIKIRDLSSIDPRYFRELSSFPKEVQKIFPDTFRIAMMSFH